MIDQPTIDYSGKSSSVSAVQLEPSGFVRRRRAVGTGPSRRLSMATCKSAHLLALNSLPPHPTIYESSFLYPRLLYPRHEPFVTILVLPGTVQCRLGRLHKHDRDEIT